MVLALGLRRDGPIVVFSGLYERDGLGEAVAALPEKASDEQLAGAYWGRVLRSGFRIVFPVAEPARRNDWAEQAVAR